MELTPGCVITWPVNHTMYIVRSCEIDDNHPGIIHITAEKVGTRESETLTAPIGALKRILIQEI